MAARDVMTTAVVSVRVGDSVRAAAEAMVSSGYAALPVLDDEENVVGLITETDVLALAIPEYLRGAGDLGFLPGSYSFPAPGVRDLDLTTVADILRTDILRTVDEDEPVIEVARIMLQQHIRRCPVVRDGKLVGIISRRDLVERILRPALEAGAP